MVKLVDQPTQSSIASINYLQSLRRSRLQGSACRLLLLEYPIQSDYATALSPWMLCKAPLNHVAFRKETLTGSPCRGFAVPLRV